MAYFIYRISEHAGQKRLQCLGQHGSFRDAKHRARQQRAQLPADSGFTIKMVFADDQEQAEALRKKKTVAPIRKDWEK